MQNQALIKDFIAEAEVQINTVEEGLLLLEKNGSDSEVVNEVFRALHSIKGTAGFFSLANIVNLSHTMENFFSEIRKGNLEVNEKAIDTLLTANDCLKEMVSNVQDSEQFDVSPHLEKISALFSAGEEPASSSKQLSGEKKLDPEKFFSASIAAGLKVFLVQYEISAGNELTGTEPPADLVENINSIGTLVTAYPPGFRHKNQLGFNPSKPFWTFLVTTVLEKSLLSTALLIEENQLEEITIPGLLPPLDPFTGEREPGGQKDRQYPGPGSPPAFDSISSERFPLADQLDNKDPVNIAKREEMLNRADPYQLTNNQVPVPGENGITKTTDESIRVSVSLLNDLMDLASEMVLSRNQLLNLLSESRKEITGLNTVLQNTDSLTTELQEKIMYTRMQPLAILFDRFPRYVRELSRERGKSINLTIKGREVELDKSIIEGLNDPLSHLLRNAIDHGIETDRERKDKGKPVPGEITIHAYQQGGHVTIDFIDDGAGINPGKIKTMATEKGLISHLDTESMSDNDYFALLFKPGFSMSAGVTDLSGRGVGLDVVQTNLQKLGGVIEITSQLNRGTTFHLTMPLTLAIIPSLIVESGGQKFALPRIELQEMVRVKPGDPGKRIEALGDAFSLRLRNRLIPLVTLEHVLGLQGKTDQGFDGFFNSRNEVTRVLIIKSGSKRFGLIIDSVHDEEEILVKQLPAYLKSCSCYSGVTILGDGSIAMILDPEGIINRARLKFAVENDMEADKPEKSINNLKEEQSLLLFKCSGPETFCVDMSMISRVEKISADQLEKIGNKLFIQFRDENMQVIRPEDYLPVAKQPLGQDRYYVIIPKMIKYPLGLLVEKLIDTHDDNIVFDHDSISAGGLMGTAILSGYTTLVVNLQDLIEIARPGCSPAAAGADAKSPGIKVLVAEDTPFYLKLEKQYLESAGYQVITAADGSEAWQILQQENVDMLVSDIVMPRMNGYELMKRIRDDEKLSALPAIALTTKSEPECVKMGMEAGFDYYEIKLNKDKLLEKIEMALEKRKTTSFSSPKG